MAEEKSAKDNRIIKLNLDLTETDVFKNETYQTNETFWTTDVNSAYLEFSTTEDVKGSVASLVLKNVDDGSLIQRNIEVTESPFFYMLKDNEIIHAGRWFGQVVVEMGGKAITARVFRFKITSSLLDSSDAALFDVENYRKLTEQLTALYDQMNSYLANVHLSEEERERAESARKMFFEESQRAREVVFIQSEESRSEVFSTSQKVKSNAFEQSETIRGETFIEKENERDAIFETSESARNVNEIERQSNEDKRIESDFSRNELFEESQSNRTAAFNQSELSRSETFNANEQDRQENETERISNENVRIKAEGVRETTFTDNEAERSEIFAFNEADRKAGEVEREQNEETRQLNETQREETFKTYDGRITNIEDGVVVEATNLAKLPESFKTANASTNITGSELTVFTTGANARLDITSLNTINSGNIVYIRMCRIHDVRQTGYSALAYNIGSGADLTWISNAPKDDKYYTYSKVVTMAGTGTSKVLIRDYMTDMVSGLTHKVKDVSILDLTTIFGLGNEPTATQMDRLLEQFPNSWFDGTENIYNSKHMMGMFFKELTKLNNAITALGGNV